jgi:hypothetical protein
MKPSRRSVLAAGVITAVACPSIGWAQESRPQIVAAQSPEPRLAGRALMRFFGLRVYEARLWVSAGASPDVFERECFLELRYALSLKGDRIADRSVDEIAGIGQGTDAQRKAWGTAMRQLFPDVSDGDRLLGHYLPRGPSRFHFNDRPIGTIEDPQFGRAFFGIWLDPRTSEPGLRAALLKGFAS